MDTINIIQLVSLAIEQRRFRFSKSEFNYTYQDLLDNNILMENSDQINIQQTTEFTEELYTQFSLTFSFSLNQDFFLTIAFYNQVEQYFKGSKHMMVGISEQMSALLAFLILKSNIDFRVTFEDELNDADLLSNRLIYKFNEAFFKALPNLLIETDKLYRISKSLHIKVVSNSNALYNSNTSAIIQGLENYCKLHITQAKKLLNFCIDDPNLIINIESAVIAGIFNNNKNEITYIKSLLISESNNIPIVCAISLFDINNISDAETILDLIDLIVSDDINLLINTPRIYIKLLKLKDITENVKSKCFLKLDALILNPNHAVKSFTLNELQFFPGYDEEIAKLLETLNSEPFETTLLQEVDFILAHRAKAIIFFKFIRKFLERGIKDFAPKEFNSSINHFLQVDQIEFINNLINLIVDDFGSLRYAGTTILKHINSLSSNTITFCEQQIMELSSIKQFKFVVSMMQSSPDPEFAIPLVLPLRKSSNSLISEFLYYKIEKELENYGKSVLRVVEDNLDVKISNDIFFMTRLKMRESELYLAASKKMQTKELNPYYTQAFLIRKFNSYFNTTVSDAVQKHVDEFSFLGKLATTVILAKGGGWKRESDSSVSQLSSYGTSFQLPREYYISPTIFDLETNLAYIENWAKKFEKWEAIILSFENT